MWRQFGAWGWPKIRNLSKSRLCFCDGILRDQYVRKTIQSSYAQLPIRSCSLNRSLSDTPRGRKIAHRMHDVRAIDLRSDDRSEITRLIGIQGSLVYGVERRSSITLE